MGPRACAGASLAWRDVSAALRRSLLCAMRAGRHGEIAARGGATEERRLWRLSGGLGLLVLRFGWLYRSSPISLDRIDTLAALARGVNASTTP